MRLKLLGISVIPLGKDVAWEEDVFPDMDSGQKEGGPWGKWGLRRRRGWGEKCILMEKMQMARKWVGEKMDP